MECYKLDTYTNTIDSDSDGISDWTEVQGFSVAGQTWYMNPLNPDSNGDGFPDLIECPELQDVDADGNLISLDLTNLACGDTDGDNTPDVFDFDDDGDGVPDRVDISPHYRGDLSQNAQSDFDLNLDGYDAGQRSVIVELQLRPTNLKHLYQTNNVLNWPDQDTQGQIRRVVNNTLDDLGVAGTRTDRGDIILAPMLEVTIPAPVNNATNPSGGLPVKVGFTGSISNSALADWLDTDALDTYNISVSENTLDNTLVAHIPLTVVEDPTGNTPIAWGTQMLYRPEVAAWGNDHTVRMVWLVQAILDTCESDCEKSANWSSELAVIQTYYEDFTLSGLKVREDYDMHVAVLAQNDALSVDYESDLWHISNGLQDAFVEGKQIDDDSDGQGDRRFDFTELTTRFGAGSGTEWDIDLNNITLNSQTYSDQTTGLRGVTLNQIPTLLDSVYGSPSVGDDATVLIAREEIYKSVSLGNTEIDDTTTGHLSVSLNNLSQQTYVTMSPALARRLPLPAAQHLFRTLLPTL
ncbi:MAG: hypothetical protein AAF485_31800, partial [Chloroflexota bacterium]